MRNGLLFHAAVSSRKPDGEKHNLKIEWREQGLHNEIKH